MRKGIGAARLPDVHRDADAGKKRKNLTQRTQRTRRVQREEELANFNGSNRVSDSGSSRRLPSIGEGALEASGHDSS